MSRFDGALAALDRQCSGFYGEQHSFLPVGATVAITVQSVDVNPMLYRHDAEGPQYEVRWARRSDLPVTPHRGDSFTIGGVSYVVTDVQSDGGDGVFLTTDRVRRPE